MQMRIVIHIWMKRVNILLLQAPLQLPACLQELSADGCVQLKRFQGLEQLTKLRRLIVGDCSELEELPMETLTSLEQLVAKGCVKLKIIGGGNIDIFVAFVGNGMYEVEEHTGIGAGNKASSPKCYRML